MDFMISSIRNNTAIIKSVLLNHEDKLEAFDMIEKLISIANKARREGIIAIENMTFDNQFLKKGISQITQGTCPELVESILKRYIIAGDYDGLELLKRLIILDGVLLIQQRENPRRIYDVLIAWLGEDFEPPEQIFESEEEVMKKIKKMMGETNE